VLQKSRKEADKYCKEMVLFSQVDPKFIKNIAANIFKIIEKNAK
jgi:hypothetical protein